MMCNGGFLAVTKSLIQVVVCDAGPIIHLDELACLSLLEDFTEVLIPDAVWDEIEHHRPQAIPVCQQIAKNVTPKQSLSPDIQATVQLFSLHVGEIQALNIASEYKANLFLTDDTAARLAAGAVNISVHGTLGILLRSIRQKQRKPEFILSTLQSIPEKSTLYLKTSLLQSVIEQVEDYIQNN